MPPREPARYLGRPQAPCPGTLGPPLHAAAYLRRTLRRSTFLDRLARPPPRRLPRPLDSIAVGPASAVLQPQDPFPRGPLPPPSASTRIVGFKRSGPPLHETTTTRSSSTRASSSTQDSSTKASSLTQGSSHTSGIKRQRDSYDAETELTSLYDLDDHLETSADLASTSEESDVNQSNMIWEERDEDLLVAVIFDVAAMVQTLTNQQENLILRMIRGRLQDWRHSVTKARTCNMISTASSMRSPRTT